MNAPTIRERAVYHANNWLARHEGHLRTTGQPWSCGEEDQARLRQWVRLRLRDDGFGNPMLWWFCWWTLSAIIKELVAAWLKKKIDPQPKQHWGKP